MDGWMDGDGDGDGGGGTGVWLWIFSLSFFLSFFRLTGQILTRHVERRFHVHPIQVGEIRVSGKVNRDGRGGVIINDFCSYFPSARLVFSSIPLSTQFGRSQGRADSSLLFSTLLFPRMCACVTCGFSKDGERAQRMVPFRM